MKFLKSLNVIYLITSLILYVIFIFYFGLENYPYVIFINSFAVLSYFAIFHFSLVSSNQLSNKHLLATVFFYNLLFIILYNALSYHYTGKFFVFSEVDAEVYHIEALSMASESFIFGVRNFLSRWEFEDLGAVFVINIIYRVYESNLLLNAFYLLLSMGSAFGLFKLSKYFMSARYAYLATLLFSTSSYFVWFNSSGLKESIMVFLVIFIFYHFYKYRIKKRGVNLFLFIGLLLVMIFFRPVVSILIIFSIIFSLLVDLKFKPASFFLISILISGVIYSTDIFYNTYERFLLGGFEEMVETKIATGMIVGSLEFTYAVNLLASFVGPFPTLISENNIVLSFYGPGLIFKTLISVPFIFGLAYIFKNKATYFFPISFFVLGEIFSLVYILEALELRKSLPHFPFIYIIGFSFIEKVCIKGHSNKKIMILLASFSMLLLIFFWNLRL